MEATEKEHLIDQCLRYIEGNELPMPLPANREEYESWRAGAAVPPELDEDVEDAWAELYRLVDEQPVIAWELICAIAARCRTDHECSTLAAGPFENFIQKYGNEFGPQIEEELVINEGLRKTHGWL